MARLNPATHDAVRETTVASAKAAWPIICATLGGAPSSLLDVGCGEGHWLAAAKQLSPRLDYLGVDCDPISDAVEFWDAENRRALPLRGVTPDRWELALCLEMAEHATPTGGKRLVKALTVAADAVVWSAAIPGQGGDGHINEQPPAYWHALFQRYGWSLRDPFRAKLWDDARVAPWYRQNMLYAAPDEAAKVRSAPPQLVHPVIFSWRL